MYKNRITKWKLDKRNKEPEMMAVVRKKRQRDAVGKASEFRARGRRIDPDDVQRYLKRKGMSVEDAIELSASTPPELWCYTPDTLPQSPTSLEVSDDPQRIFVEIRHYILGSVDSKTWFIPAGHEYHLSAKGAGNKSVTADFEGNLLTAFDLLNRGSHMRAGQFLVKGSALIQGVLMQESPEMLSQLLNLILVLRNGWIDCSNIIIKQFSRMANTIFPELHPLRHIFNLLYSLDRELAEDVFVSVWESFLDIFEQALHASSANAIRCRLDYIFRIQRVRNSDKAEAQLRAIVEGCKEAYGRLDHRYRNALLAFADFLRLQERYTEAAAAAEEVIRCAGGDSSPFDKRVWCRGMETVALCKYESYDDEAAEATLRQVIEMHSTTWGWQDVYTLRLLTTLEDWLTKFGRHEEAAQPSQQVAEIMSQSNAFL